MSEKLARERNTLPNKGVCEKDRDNGFTQMNYCSKWR